MVFIEIYYSNNLSVVYVRFQGGVNVGYEGDDSDEDDVDLWYDDKDFVKSMFSYKFQFIRGLLLSNVYK